MKELAPRIVADLAVHAGEPVIKGTRVPAAIVIGQLSCRMSVEDVAEAYAITRHDVLAALRFAAEVVSGRVEIDLSHAREMARLLDEDPAFVKVPWAPPTEISAGFDDEPKATISIDSAIMMGKPVVAGTRITVELILEKLGSGRSFDQMVASYPHLSEDQVRSALRYAARRLDPETPSER
jgi:uncharacterized protein (DUF433 family)